MEFTKKEFEETIEETVREMILNKDKSIIKLMIESEKIYGEHSINEAKWIENMVGFITESYGVPAADDSSDLIVESDRMLKLANFKSK